MITEEELEKRKKSHQRPRPKKIDIHTHLGNPEDMQRTALTPQQREAVDDLLDIEQIVILPYPDDPDHPDIFDNRSAEKLCTAHPEHYLHFCNIEPDGTERTREKLIQYQLRGALGVGEIGIGGKKRRYHINSPEMLHLFAVCEELDMPVVCHMAPSDHAPFYGVIDDDGLPGLERVLKKYPDLKFLGHSQIFWRELTAHSEKQSDLEKNFLYEKEYIQNEGRLQELMRTYPNLYCDLSATSGANALMRDPLYAMRFISEFQERILFGSDITNTKTIPPLSLWLDSCVLTGRITFEIYEKICRTNAIRLLGLENNSEKLNEREN